MVVRYMFVKLKDAHADEMSRREISAHTRAVLPGVPGIERVEVGVPADGAALASWDLSIAVSFTSLEAIEPARAQPDHRRYIDEFLRPRAEIIKAWNFDLES